MESIDLYPGEPLANQKHEVFAQCVAKGDSQSEAYRKAYNTGKMSPQSLSTCGGRLLKIVEVQKRVVELQKAAACGVVLTIEEKRKFLADCIRTPIGRLNADSPLAQKVRVTPEGMEVVMVDKLRALELDAKLAGELGDAQHGVTIHNNGPAIQVLIPTIISSPRPLKRT